jgi:Tfp pilus assembly protein PilF
MIAAALATSPPDVDIVVSFVTRQLRIGLEYYAAGAIEEAIAAYRRGLAAVEDESPGCVAVETISQLHANLGNACMVRGDLEFAAANYKAALRLAPALTSCWCNLGNVQLRCGEPQQAIALYLQALTLNPGHWPSRTNLVQALMATQQYLVAKALLNELETAVEHFTQAIALDPRDAESLYWIGGIRQRMGDASAAQAAYAQAAQIQPLIRRAARKSPADFRVLALYAPFAGNTPTEYLFGDCDYDIDTLALFAGSEFEAARLQQDVQVVVNLISDADQAQAVLPMVADLVGRLGKPVVNDPGKIGRTTRDATADVLAGIPGCRIPKVLRLKADADVSAATLQQAFPQATSILIRPAGTHGGDDFERIEDASALAAQLAERPGTDRYLIEYIDYQSADGYFRKYRFIFVDGEILPYHLAIGNGWKVHHANTDMANQPWMQREEQAFLADPASVFDAGNYRVLRAIRERIGLEYFGIDCGLDRCGNLVVFEVNASMLVHQRNDEFPYKTPFVRRIKQAFDRMLRKLASADNNPGT